MSIELITNRTVESCLQSIRNGDNQSCELEQLKFISLLDHSTSLSRQILVNDYLIDTIEIQYLAARRSEDLSHTIPESRANCILQIQKDYSCGNSNLEAWSALFFRYISTIPISVEDISSAASVAPQQLRRRINVAINLLVNRLQHEEAEAERKYKPFGNNIPSPDYAQLVGIDAALQLLEQKIENEENYQIFSLEGMGGIGKTSLARAFVSQRHIRDKWEDIIWVSAKQQVLNQNGSIENTRSSLKTYEEIITQMTNQLRMVHLADKSITDKITELASILAEKPYLVVIDNLETIEDYSMLVPEICKWDSKSRFIITTRESLKQYPIVSCIPINELSETEAYQLMCNEIQRRGRMAPLPKEEFSPLHDLIGGIPLAIKLSAGQLQLRSLDGLINDIRQATGSMEKLYQYLYWQSWSALSNEAKNLLLSFLSLDPDGENVDFLLLMSGLRETDFYTALNELDQYSLVEPGGTASLPLLRLHRITATFLQTNLLGSWIKPV